MTPTDFKVPLGELLKQAGLISKEQIELALEDQTQYDEMKIGEILAIRGWIKPQTTDFFASQWHYLINKGKDRPLGYYLQQAGLLDESQIKAILYEQKRYLTSPKFGEIAVSKGWLAPNTIEFFIENLIPTERASLFAQKNIYELIKLYLKGKTDFPNLNLIGCSLQNITLKGINLENSNFQESDLKQINLSYSKLNSVNFAMANLERALLKNSEISNSCFYRANLQETAFDEADLRRADLRKTDLTKASFRKTNLIGADLRGAHFNNTFLNGAIYDRNTLFDDAINPHQLGMKLISVNINDFSLDRNLIEIPKQSFVSSLLYLIKKSPQQ
jgi:uncharacterized protein YjbI with pentapeptide repeats